jgi:mono/diheme cytochrome c family protein
MQAETALSKSGRWISFAAALLLCAVGPDRLPDTRAGQPDASAGQPTFSVEQIEFFERDVLPILQAHCFKCHGDIPEVKGGLRLFRREHVFNGGESGPAASLETPDESLILTAIHYRDGLEMPPAGKLPPAKINTLTRWVREGLPWPHETASGTPGEAGNSLEAGRQYWAYQPRVIPPVPPVKNGPWCRSPIDTFILSRLEEEGLEPSPPADRLTFIRRATYDLLGLPPTPEAIDRFLADDSPRAYERLVDQLLSSPHYGERWGRHWLDLVRFAETNGYERDGAKPYAWRFRDYVIRSFNGDKPFDRFLIEQLAGDELPERTADSITATGYYRLGLWDDEPADPEQARYDELDDVVATTAQVFLGITMNCARCHDHKIDPVPQSDYYRFLAFFQDLPPFSDTRDVRSRFNLTDVSPPEKRRLYEAELSALEAQQDKVITRMRMIEDAGIARMSAEDRQAAAANDRQAVIDGKLAEVLNEGEAAEYTQLKLEREAIKKAPQPDRDLALSINHCQVPPPQTHVLIRGNPDAPGDPVAPGFPRVLADADPLLPAIASDARTSGRRTVLAEWIASSENPLSARVLANRLWQHHFGRGIVPTPNDFGKFGEPPTHPELLDWLAGQVVQNGWELKPLHRMIMLSSTYRMSSRSSAAGMAVDPGNRKFWRFNPRRLSAEEIRDSMLAAGGSLNLEVGGPSVYPPISKEVLAGQSRPGEGWGEASPAEASRRSVYAYVKRSLLVPILSQHDAPDTDSTCPVRYTTTVPTQALGMLNGEFSREQSAHLAARVEREAPDSRERQVHRAIRLTTGRAPDPAEVAQDVAFLRQLEGTAGCSAEEALRLYALVLLNANEFIYLD